MPGIHLGGVGEGGGEGGKDQRAIGKHTSWVNPKKNPPYWRKRQRESIRRRRDFGQFKTTNSNILIIKWDVVDAQEYDRSSI